MKRLLVSMVVMLWGSLGWGAGVVEQTDLAFADATAQSQAGYVKTGNSGQGGGDPGQGGGDPGPIVAEPSSWSLFFYLAIDNELEAGGDLSLVNMLDATADLEYHPRILVLVDRLSTEGTDVFEIVGGEQVMVASYDEQVSSDPAVLQDFVTMALDDFASVMNALIIKSEGFSWRGTCRDNTHPGQDMDTLMSNGGVADALMAAQVATGTPLDMLLLEASCMGFIEVVYELRDAVDLLLTTETKIQPNGGIPWPMILNDMAQDGDISPVDLGVVISDNHRDYWEDKGNHGDPADDTYADFASMSVLDMTKMGPVFSAHNAYCETIVPLFEELRNVLPHARDLSEIGGFGSITDFDYQHDIVTFQDAALMIIEQKGLSYPDLAAAIADYQAAHYDMVLYNVYADKFHDKTQGLSIWYPPTYNKYNTTDPVGDVTFGSTIFYEDPDIALDWIADSNWLWYLDEYFRAVYNYNANRPSW